MAAGVVGWAVGATVVAAAGVGTGVAVAGTGVDPGTGVSAGAVVAGGEVGAAVAACAAVGAGAIVTVGVASSSPQEANPMARQAAGRIASTSRTMGPLSLIMRYMQGSVDKPERVWFQREF